MSNFPQMECRAPRFRALIPFFVFIVFYLGLSIWARDFYKVPMPTAFLVASAAALVLDHKRPLSEKVEIYARGMGEPNIMIMCLIFILAGAFASTAKGMGAVDGAVAIARAVVPDSLMLLGMFLVSSFISLAVGTSCGTIAALTPIAAGLAGGLSIPGDPARRDRGRRHVRRQPLHDLRHDHRRHTHAEHPHARQVPPEHPAGAAGVRRDFGDLPFLRRQGAGGRGGAGRDLVERVRGSAVPADPRLRAAWLERDAAAFRRTVLAGITGIINGAFDFWGMLDLVGKGTLGMSETLIVAILAGGLLQTIRRNGGIGYIMEKIRKPVHSARGCEFGVLVLVAVINLFTANNTVAIVIAGPIARELSEQYHCSGKRIASILDTRSCVVQGMIPYGAQILIAAGVAQTSNLDVSSLGLVGSLFYPILLGICLIVAIAIHGKNRPHPPPEQTKRFDKKRTSAIICNLLRFC